MKDLNALASQIHANAVDHGWWGPVRLVDGKAYFDAKARNFGEVLMLIVSEAAEALDEWRDGREIDMMLYEHRGGDVNIHPETEERKPGKPVGIPSELADIIIRTLDAAAAYGVDIEAAVRIKMAYNENRPYLHGRAR
jgi:hypothetical protein